jgi:P-type E1-E2 ATPase
MLELSVPGRGEYHLEHLALDLNGTLALDGSLIDGVAERLMVLREQLEIHLLTADTFGVASEIERELEISVLRIRTTEEKTACVERLGGTSVVAIGNGANDAGMLAAAGLGIAVLGPEGLAKGAMETADVVTPGILAALDLLLKHKRLVATLRP